MLSGVHQAEVGFWEGRSHGEQGGEVLYGEILGDGYGDCWVTVSQDRGGGWRRMLTVAGYAFDEDLYSVYGFWGCGSRNRRRGMHFRRA